MDVSEARRLKELERENRRLKSAVADMRLGEQALKEALRKNGKPAARRAAVRFVRERYEVSERRSCQMAGLSRWLCRRKSLRAEADRPIQERLIELAARRPRFDYRRLHVLLLREAFRVNGKRVYRLHRELGLAMKRKRRKRVAQAKGEEVTADA